jgi:orotate phosphoribosyltransferase
MADGADDRSTLLNLLASHAYDYKPKGFTLTSGKVSDEYLDCKMALSHAEALPALGHLVVSKMDPRAVAIGGLTMGSDPIAISAACASASHRPVRWFSVRKDSKEHGRKKTVEGDVAKGECVVVVDDVATTGGSTIEAIEKCRSHGLQVVQVIVLVDREEGGLTKIKDVAGTDVEVVAIFSKSEVRRQWDGLKADAAGERFLRVPFRG